MTLLEFAEAFRKLLLQAEREHGTNTTGETADAVLAASWDVPMTEASIPDNLSSED